MTQYAISFIGMVMGRPPLNMTPTLVRFPSEILERVDTLVGHKHRAKFIREAVTAEIERREQAASEEPSVKADNPATA
ncbi:hypothetical protein AB4144_54980 [Rhizobiaceae sp. 2RAB30]